MINKLRLFSGLLCLCGYSLQAQANTDYFCFQAKSSQPILFFSAKNPLESLTLQYYPYLKPIQLRHFKTESLKTTLGRPDEFHDFYYEIMKGIITGHYEVVHQGAQFYAVTYTQKSTGKQTLFNRLYSDQVNSPLQFSQQGINCI